MRITNKDLEAKLRRLNAISTAQYGIEGAYGGVRLVRICDPVKHTIADVGPRFSKTELYHALWMLEDWVLQEDMVKKRDSK